jgi:hypothetical protein
VFECTWEVSRLFVVSGRSFPNNLKFTYIERMHRTFPVSTYYLEDLLEQTNHVIEDGSCCARRDRVEHSSFSIQITSRGGEKRRETIDYEHDSHQNFNDDFSDCRKETRRYALCCLFLDLI